jgi:hypothetical protein
VNTPWWIIFLPTAIGLLSAGQAIQSKQGSDFFSALSTAWGSVYWLSRGLVPAATYLVWYFAQHPPAHSVLAATLCGLGSEAFLRTKLYVGQAPPSTSGGKAEDIFVGLFNLIEWYQAYFLKRSGIALAKRRRKLVSEMLKATSDFRTLSRHVKASAASLNEDEKIEVRNKTNDLLSEFNKEMMGTPEAEAVRIHETFIYELGYALLKLVGQRGLSTLIL